MNRNLLIGLTLVTLLASLVSTAVAKPAHTEQSVASLGHTETIPVTWKNFVRAESDLMFKSYVKMGAFGKFLHIPKPTPIDQQKVVRMNRDTIYSLGVFDLTTPVTITKPDTGKRFQSMQVVNEDQYTPMVVYKPGKYTLTKDKMGTRYVFVVVRTLVDSEDTEDIKKVNAIQQQTTVEQKSVGTFEMPDWDKDSQDKVRAALKVLSATMENYDGAFGSKDEVDPTKFLFASATGWGGNPQKDAMYAGVTPEKNDGKTAYTLKVKDVPVDGFWSISLYNGEGYFQKNQYNAYSVNSITGKKNKDGSMIIHFGGDSKQPNFLPIMKGWNYLVRLYQPSKKIMDGSWTFPKPMPVK
ncbi:MAG: DUF1214 domain-containing protein [Desulfuromonadales bacterium]|nr:DUF1214 domain-containing protein [Desulfuromonadales bacterium]